MKKLSKLLSAAVLLVAVLCVVIAPNSTAQADTGPKPSVQITFENMGDELCYCTLLSKTETTGPHSVWQGDEKEIEYSNLDRETFFAFVNYRDSDGFFFLQYARQCNESKSFSWGYYPPYTFKVLLYYPETNTFVISGICKRYAFDSYFSVELKGADISVTHPEPQPSPQPSDPQLVVTKNYNYFKEIATLLCRMVITVAVELAIALLFRFRGKKVWWCLVITNVVTQLLLNIALNIVNYYEGMLMLVLVYFLAELCVFAVEAVTYGIAFQKLGETKVSVWKSIVYALVANLASFGIGMIMALFIPALF